MSESNRTSTIQTFEKYKGQFVIADTLPHSTVRRFVGIGVDEWDYLYIFFDGRKLCYTSILSPIIPLKGYIEDKHYNEFIRIWNLNSFDKPWDEEWMPKISTEEEYNNNVYEYRCSLEDSAVNNGVKLLAPLCWEVN